MSAPVRDADAAAAATRGLTPSIELSDARAGEGSDRS